MNTQNVNVKTATKESSERWVKTSSLRTDGFVRNIDSRHPFDVIRADVVLERMEKHAHRGCGLHYEIYQSRVLEMALSYLEALPLKDRPILMGAAARRGYILTWAAGVQAKNGRDELMNELANDY